MGQDNKALKRYLRRVKKNLPCSGKEKGKIVGDLKNNITDYLLACPDATLQDIEEHFGSPESIALSCVEQTEVNTIIKKIRIRKTVLHIVAATAALIVLLWAGVVGWAAVQANDNSHSRVIDYINGEIIRITFD